MRQWYPESKVLAQSFAFTLKFYYVYKIEILPTKHFYIGCTGDISTRLAQHLDKIDDAMMSSGPLGVYNFYETAGKLLMEHLGMNEYDWDNINATRKKVRKSIFVTAVAICQEKNHAFMIESVAINENIDNPLCLNLRGRP
jgi:hypothetical protein